MDIKYRFMKKGEEGRACALIEKVFNEFVAPDYGQEGVDEFFKFANPQAMAGRRGPEQVVIVAEKDGDIVGIIEMRNSNHIALLFVSCRGEGIAKRLFKRAVKECRKRHPDLKTITVNSSLFAEPVYTRMGFMTTGSVQKKNGIIFVPMALDVRKA
jgi:hypothetical protein